MTSPGISFGPGALGGTGAQARPLAPLREDVDLHPAARLADGSPSWVLQDRARNRFFRVGWVEFEILRRWGQRLPLAVMEGVNRETAARITLEDIDALRDFLADNYLLRLTGAEGRAGWQAALAAGRSHWAMWLLKNYLYLRLHLVRPDRFLRAALPLVRPLMTRAALVWAVLFALFGAVLVLHQWDAFIASAPQFMTPDGLALYGGALIFAKVMHELGHGFVAAKHGLRVPSMGVALLVMWPVLYTDTSEAWKLTDRRARLQIGAAGMATELMLAALALNLWLLLPPGQLRGAVFALAAVTWIMTLAINLNPLMRFDGYYLLSDVLGIENLQDRSFALGRWQLRRLMFRLDEPCPEPLPDAMRRVLVAYAVCTWIYRLFLFIGIALLVYYLTFKLLGIALMAAEIGFFVVLPVLREMGRWWERRALFRLNLNLLATLCILGGLGAAALLPWKTTIQTPAVFAARAEHAVYPPFPARIAAVAVRPGQRVAQGEALFDLSAPDIVFSRDQAARRAAALSLQMERERGERRLRERGGVLREQLARALAERDGYDRELARLRIAAPFDGTVTDIASGMAPGRWVNEKDRLALLVAGAGALVEGYVEAGDLGSIEPGAAGRFYADGDPGAPLPVRVETIDPAATTRLPRPHLASRHGGGVEVRSDAEGALTPETPVYRIVMRPAGDGVAPHRVVRGAVVLDGPPRSFAERAWRAVAAVVIRESGF
jgi:putative peptide zinc metalloprotease protein